MLAAAPARARAQQERRSRQAALRRPASSLPGPGAALYAANCSSCHGPHGQGIAPPGRPGVGDLHGEGPPLTGVGALAADFYLRTGFMPLADPHREPSNSPVLFSDANIRKLVGYVASLGHGPPIPSPDPATGILSEGFAALRRPLRRLPPDTRPRRLRDRRSRAAAHRTDRRRDRRSGSGGAVRDADLRAEGDLRPPARLDRPLRRLCPASLHPGRLGDRADRPGARRDGRLADRRGSLVATCLVLGRRARHV